MMACISAVGSLSNVGACKICSSSSWSWHWHSRRPSIQITSMPISLSLSLSNLNKTNDAHAPAGSSEEEEEEEDETQLVDRRKLVLSSIGLFAATYFEAGPALASQFADMPALRGKDYGKTKMRYPDYTETNSGLQYKDLRVGNGPTPKIGETVVVDWDGYTIGYYGRIFEARNKTKGGSFQGDDKEFYKFKIGSQEVIPAFEEAVSGMALDGDYCSPRTGIS